MSRGDDNRSTAAEEDSSNIHVREDASLRIARRHLRLGWWLLLLFLSLGLALETLIGIRNRWFMEDGLRREMWRLAHAHGTLLSLINIALGATLPLVSRHRARLRQVASPCLVGATFSLPGGFFLGGLWTYAGMPQEGISYSNDPGYGIVLVPLGAVLLMAAVFLVALSLRK